MYLYLLLIVMRHAMQLKGIKPTALLGKAESLLFFFYKSKKKLVFHPVYHEDYRMRSDIFVPFVAQK
jgi:hypothetical protein